MTRIQLIEAPYLEEYINWHLQLGFNHIYFLNTEYKCTGAIKKFIDPALHSMISFINHSCPTNVFLYLRNAFNTQITEDYILHIDSDEYFMLPHKYTSISNFVEKNKADKYIFRWTNIPINKLYAGSMTEYLLSDEATGRYCPTHKMMVNRQTWLADASAKIEPHKFICRGSTMVFSNPNSDGETPFLIHFLVRGHLHTAVKVLEQRLPTEKGKTPKKAILEFLRTEVPLDDYPFRFIIATGEYAINTSNYLSKKKEWRIPRILKYSDRTQEIQELYKATFERHKLGSVVVNKDLLTDDVFLLKDKIDRYMCKVRPLVPKLKGQMPSIIGEMLKGKAS